eukprot:scaffold6810_cov145-Skeletonema_marinoi.AAC.1
MAVFIDRARCRLLLGNVAVWKEDTNSPVNREGTIAIVMTTSMVTDADVETPPIRTRMYRIMTSQRGCSILAEICVCLPDRGGGVMVEPSSCWR